MFQSTMTMSHEESKSLAVRLGCPSWSLRWIWRWFQYFSGARISGEQGMRKKPEEHPSHILTPLFSRRYRCISFPSWSSRLILDTNGRLSWRHRNYSKLATLTRYWIYTQTCHVHVWMNQWLWLRKIVESSELVQNVASWKHQDENVPVVPWTRSLESQFHQT